MVLENTERMAWTLDYEEKHDFRVTPFQHKAVAPIRYLNIDDHDISFTNCLYP